MTANAEQDKASLPLMSDCTDLPAGIVPRDRGINDALRALVFDFDRVSPRGPERCASAGTELREPQPRQRSRPSTPRAG